MKFLAKRIGNGAQQEVQNRIAAMGTNLLYVQAGSMNKAAALLNTGQSAISRSIAELEHTVGVRLVDRNPRGVEATKYGRALLDGGAAVFDDLRQAVRTIPGPWSEGTVMRREATPTQTSRRSHEASLHAALARKAGCCRASGA